MWLLRDTKMAGDEKGATLVGQLAALGIIGLALIMLLVGLASSGRGLALVQERVMAANCARRQMEAIKAASYRANPTVAPYPTVATTGIYSASVEVSYWISTTFQSAVPGQDYGLQFITVTVYSILDPGEPVLTLEDYKGDR
jgi:hypothetical protein